MWLGHFIVGLSETNAGHAAAPVFFGFWRVTRHFLFLFAHFQLFSRLYYLRIVRFARRAIPIGTTDTLRTSLEKVAETVYQSSSGICSRGGFKHSMWKPISHSSHKIILSQFCLPAHTLHPHSRHSLFRSSLHFLQWYGYFPYFWKVKSEFLVEFLQCILRCLCVRGLSLCSVNRVGVSILIHSWINLILQSIILSSPMQILPIMSTLSTLSKWRSYLN